jgi:hypothetical protein
MDGMPDAQLTVRRATKDDLDAVVRFNAAMALETEGIELDRNTLRAGVNHALTNASASLYFLAEVGGTIVGQTMVTFEWSDWRNGLFWWIQSVYVQPDLRRVGVFRALNSTCAVFGFMFIEPTPERRRRTADSE